jgi:hypothetical protein
MRGTDGEIHSATLEATSVFHAADQAIRRWSMFWWFSPDAPITAQSGEDKWTVAQERIRRWRDELLRRSKDAHERVQQNAK